MSQVEEQREVAKERKSTAQRILRFGLWFLAVLLTVQLVAVVLIFLALQTQWGADLVRHIAVSQANTVLNATVHVERFGGNFFTNIRAYDVTLEQDGQIVASVDTASVSFRALPLLWRSVQLTDVYLASPQLLAYEDADGVWNYERLVEPSEPDTAFLWTINIAQFNLRNGSATLNFYAPQTDSTVTVDDINLQFSDFRMSMDETLVTIDTLWARAQTSDRPDPVHLNLAASMQRDRFEVSTMRLTSDLSEVTAEGFVPLGNRQDSIFFVAQARPLDTRDVRAFVPHLEVFGTLDLDLRMEGRDGLAAVAVEAAAGDGARLELNGTFSLVPEEQMTYLLAGSIRNLNPAYFTGDQSISGNLNVDFESDLSGASLEDLNGSAALTASGSSWRNQPIRQTEILLNLDDGAANFSLETGIGSSIIQTDGSGRFFEEIPSYTFQGRFHNINLANFTADPEQYSDLTGRFSYTGEGSEPSTAVGRGSFTLSPSAYGDLRISGATLAATLQAGQVNFDVNTELAGGRVTASGFLQPFGDEIRYQVARGAFQELNLAALSEDTTASSLNGTFSVTGEGSDPQSMWLDGGLEMRNSYYGDYQINEATLASRLSNARVVFNSAANLEGAFVEAAGEARPFDEPLRLAIRQGAFRDVDVGALMQDTSSTSNLAGTFELQMVGSDAETMSVAFQMELGPSTYNEYAIDAGQLTADMEQGLLTFSSTLQSAAGTAELAGTTRPLDDVPTYSLTEASLRNVNIAIFSPEGMESDISATLTAEGRGFDMSEATLTARLELLPSTINEASFEGGFADVTIEQGVLELLAQLDAETGVIHFTAGGRVFDEVPEYAFSARTDTFDVAGFLGSPHLDTNISLAADIRGRGIDPTSMDAEGYLFVSPSRVLGTSLDSMRAAFVIQDAHLSLDTLYMRADVADMTAGGRMALTEDHADDDSELTFHIDVKTLSPLEDFADVQPLTGQGDINGRVYGENDAIVFDIQLRMEHLAYNENRLGRLAIDLVGEQREELAVRTHARADNLSTPSILVERTDAEITYTAEEIDFSVDFRADPGRSGQIAGQVTVIDELQVLAFDDLSLELNNTQFRLLQRAFVEIENDQYRIRNFLLFGQDQQIAVDGVVDFVGDQSLIVTIENVQVAPFSDLFQFEGLSGIVDASLLMSGPAVAPEITGSFLISDLRSFDDPVGVMQADLTYEDFQMSLSSVLRHQLGQEMRIEGVIPMDMSLTADVEPPPAADVQLTIEAQAFPVDIFRPFLDRETVNRIGGTISTEIQVSGTLEEPVLDGRFTFRDGVVGLPQLGVVYQDLIAEATLVGNQATIDQLQMRAGSGTMAATGSLAFQELALEHLGLDLEIEMRRFQAIDTEQYRLTTSGSLELQGTYLSPVLAGAVVVDRGDLDITEQMMAGEIEAVALTERDIQVLESRFGIRVGEAEAEVFDFYDAMAMDISIRIERNVWVRSRRNPRMNIEVIGDLDMQKQPQGEPLYFGEIQTTDRSRVEQFGRRFEITTGNLTFNGPIEEMIMDIEADLRIRSAAGTRGEPEVIITLGLEGTMEELRPTLTSEPPMEMAAMLSYIATGRPPGEGFFAGGNGGGVLGGAADVATGFAFGQLTDLLEGFAATGLGLDVVDIQHDDTRGGTVLTAGKYVTNDIFASISRPLTTERAPDGVPATQITVEYEAFRWLLVRFIRRHGTQGMDLLWEYTY